MKRPSCSACLHAIMAAAGCVFPAAALAAADAPTDPLSASSPADCHEEGKDPLCGHFKATLSRLLAQDGMGPSEPITAGEADTATDVTHVFLDIELDPVAKTVAGTSTIDAVSTVNGLTTFTLDLRSNMVVDGVTIGGAPAAFTWAGHTIEIALGRAYNTSEAFQAAVRYHGSPINTGYGSFTWSTHGSPATVIASTLSEPWYAHTWWPCKDSLDDKFTADVWITAPNWMVAASNGVLLGTDALSGNRLRYRWQESYPIATYLVSLAATNYVTWTQYYDHADGSMPVVFYAYPESQSTVQSGTTDLVTQIATYSRADVFGQYPFLNEKYGLAQFPWGGGMEHQTITSQGVFTSWLNSHELAHQWWGDAVTCATWHDIWLNEGFATWAEAVYLEKRPGGTLADYRNWMISQRRPSDSSGTVYVYDATSMGAVFSTNNVYRKGGWVMHMLRHVVGDVEIFDILAAYRATYEGDSATTTDFKAVAESVSGRDLTWFFNEWVYGAGAPSYRYGWQNVRIGSTDYVRLHVQQYQTAYPVFSMPIDVTIATGAGAVTTAVWNNAAWQWYLLPASGPASSVQFDKDTWILRDAATNTTYVNGPPKLVSASPAPQAYIPRTPATTTIALGFSEAITWTPDDFTVTGAATGTQPVTVSYDAATFTIRLDATEALSPGDTYTVTVHDTVSSAAAGMALDGEMPSSPLPVLLPSGDGRPGGDAVIQFTIASYGDFDLDTDVDLDDFSHFQACFNGPNRPTPPPPTCTVNADSDGDGDGDLADFGRFQSCFNGPNRPPKCRY